jgi:hypothetical protein
VVVVYKVDRLTRALSDFAKLVEVFDRRGVSFVSITQQFNTTTSMGRLTLNVLLSFAQFEREVIGERVRDKIAASKKKGMWMGGTVPLGYDVKDRKLVVNDVRLERWSTYSNAISGSGQSVLSERNWPPLESGASDESTPMARNLVTNNFRRGHSICCFRTGLTGARQNTRTIPIPENTRQSSISRCGTMSRRYLPTIASHGRQASAPSSQVC